MRSLKRRGFGHVEAVLTLVIFIGVIASAFIFFNPFRANRTLSSTLDYAWREINRYSEEAVDSYSVVLKPTSPQFVALKIPGAPEKNASVLNSSGNPISYFNNDAGINFIKPRDNFVVIQYSNNFSNGNPSVVGTIISENDFSISSSDSVELLFENKLLNLNYTYYSDYIGLKKQFNLPNRVDFGFLVQFSDGSEISALNNISSKIEIESKIDKLLIVRNSGKREYAEVIVQVW